MLGEIAASLPLKVPRSSLAFCWGVDEASHGAGGRVGAEGLVKLVGGCRVSGGGAIVDTHRWKGGFRTNSDAQRSLSEAISAYEDGTVAT